MSPNPSQEQQPQTQPMPRQVVVLPSHTQQAVAYQAPVQPQAPTPPPAAYAPVPAPTRLQEPLRKPTEREMEQAAIQETPELRIYSHSNLFYWWPVWLVGSVVALLTYFQGETHEIGGFVELYHPNNSLGLVFFMTLLLVVLITNVAVRGTASGMVILAILLATVLLAYFDLWNSILAWLGNLSIHLNLGAYGFFSAAMFIIWASTVFIFDRLTYWLITPGQITEVHLFGGGEKSYDTENLVLEKFRDDVFRHWILGLGSGDIKLQTFGATHREIYIPNVLFLGRKIETFQRMIATKPESFMHTAPH